MNLRKIKKIVVLIPTFALAILLVQENYNWIFGLMIGAAIALSSCEMIQKAIANSFLRKSHRRARYFLFAFFFRFILFGFLLYVSIVYFHVNVIAITISFSIIQLLYPFYIIHRLESHTAHA